MSSGKHSKHRPRTVTHNQNHQVQMTEVPIYDNVDRIRDRLSRAQPGPGGPEIQTGPGPRTGFRTAAVCLGALCVLLAAAVVVLSTLYISVKSDSNFRLQSVGTAGKQQNTSSPNHTRIQNQIKDLEAKNRQLQEEVNKLNIRTKDCGSGWTRFGCSCYFASSERKTWSEGRLACKEGKESDLVVINSKEEQDFVSELMKHDEFWIGLRTTQNKTGFEWEWVNESQLTETFWTGLSVPPTGLYVAACCDRQGKLIQSDYKSTEVKRFVCEK